MNVLPVVVDTCSWINYFKGMYEETIDRALQNGSVFLPPIVASELISGLKTAKDISQLCDFFADLTILELDFSHWVRVGALRGQLLKKGLTISIPDCHVAQFALDLKANLISEDRIFEKIAKFSDLKIYRI